MSRRRASERGIALVAVVVVLAFLSALAATIAMMIGMDTQTRGAFGHSLTGFYAAESGLNKGMGDYKNIFLSFNVPSGTDFDEHTFALGTRTVKYKLQDKNDPPGTPEQITIPSGQVFAGLNSLQYDYTANSKSYSALGDIEASVGAEFLVGNIPLFQFLAFYAGDLEVLPGANMTLNGRLHTNGNLYLNAESGKTLAIWDNYALGIPTVQVSAVGDVYRGRKNTSTCLGTVSIDKLEDIVAPTPNDLDARELACVGGGTTKISTAELAKWKGSIVPNIESINVPQPDQIARLNSQGFWQKADLRIALVLNQADQLPGGPVMSHTIEVQDAAGNRDATKTTALHNFMADAAWNSANSSYKGTMAVFYTDLPDASGSTCTDANPGGCNNNVSTAYPAGFSSNNRVYASIMGSGLGNFDLNYRRGGFYNWREKKWIRMLNVNVGDLLAWNRTNGEPFFLANDTTDGGLVVFLTVVGPASSGNNNYGVRVFGSTTLSFPALADPTGITIVSDQAMYAQGHFNNTGTWQPAAIIGDTINVLSQGYWTTGCTSNCTNDRQSNLSLGDALRDAASTVVNAAFLGGIDPTVGATYNGGLENYPRFHEDWGGRTLTYSGSFVSLGTPAHQNGAWCGTGGTLTSGCNIYNPPTRTWNYEPKFNDAKYLPPLTPRFVYVQQVLFTEDFK
ncbi:hypothetical protein L6Q96_14245 [Candidatus Binatia bacterium]|nr:hypothetical protein [Candidatus Binatia bacterium]